MRKCTVCWFDLILVESQQEDVDLIYPYPGVGPTQMRLDLCHEHLAIAHDPSNTVQVLS